MTTHSIREDRSIHLIDIENQLGTSCIEAAAIDAWFQHYGRLVEHRTGDLIVMATSTRHTI